MPPRHPARDPARPQLPGQLGRRPADPARLANTVRLTLTGVVPDHPLAADHLAGVPRWMPGGNFTYGTCGPTSVANHAVLTWRYLLGEDITVTDAQVYDLYRRSGNPGFDPATGAGDNGVDMSVMLAELVRNGIGITHADGTTETVKPLCFAAHAADTETVHAVTAIFGASLFGLDLDVAQQGQTVWDYRAGSPAWGGHATCAGSYTSASGAGQVDESNVTWAKVVGTTDLFIRHQLAEAYIPVWPALWDHPAFTAGVDRAALAADYTACTGRPFPLPVPPPEPAPPPPPAPEPPPAPDPDVIHVDAADTALAAAIPAGWAAARHTGKNAKAAKAVAAWLAAKGLP
jgi:hypothetical protein